MAVRKLKPANEIFRINYKSKCFWFCFVLVVAVTLVCSGVKLYNNKRIDEIEHQIAEVQLKVDKIEKENAYNTSVLNSPDKSEFLEKYAREVHGYGKPGEYVFEITGV